MERGRREGRGGMMMVVVFRSGMEKVRKGWALRS